MMKKISLALLLVVIMTSLIIPVYAKKPDPKPKGQPTQEHHVTFIGAINWEGDTNVKFNKRGFSTGWYFRNTDPQATEFAVDFIGEWPDILNGGVTVIASDHLSLQIWWQYAQQDQLVRFSLTFYHAGDEWLLKAEGTEIDEYIKGEKCTITLSGFSLNNLSSGEPIPSHYEPLEPERDVTLLFSKNN
jgi:hypothetical protein